MKLAAAVLFVSLAAAQVLTPPKRVTPSEPAETRPGMISRTMTAMDAQSFATALAHAGHKAGFIMPISERQGMVPPDSGEMLTLDEAVAAFTARGQYTVRRQGGVHVFTHVKTPADISNALGTSRPHYAIKGTFALALYDVVLRELANRPMARIRTNEPGASADCPVLETLEVPAARMTSIETMNALVSRVKGVAWLVRFGQPRESLRLQIGYVCGNGVWSALSVPGW